MSKPLLDIMNLNLNRYGSKFDKDKFIITFMEEVQEILDALEHGDTEAFIDGCNDVIVVAAGGITQSGYNPELTLKQVVKEITSREQDPTQKEEWAKNPSLQDTQKWKKNKDQTNIYKADFSTCRLPIN